MDEMNNQNRPKFNIYTGEPIEYPDEKAEEVSKPKFDMYTGEPIEEKTESPESVPTDVATEPGEPVAETNVSVEPAQEETIEITKEECESVQTAQPSAAPTGEYRYIPPYEEAKYKVQEAPKPEKTTKEKKKKAKKTFSVGAVAVILVACVILSLAAGAGGAIVVNRLMDKEPASSVQDTVDTVAPDTDKPTAIKPSTGTSENLTGDVMATEDVVNAVASSVVEVEVESQVSYGMYQYIQSGAGSGVIISEDGYIVTNAHVTVNESTNKVVDTVLVRTNDGTEYDAKVVGYDKDGDISLLKIDAKGLNAAVIGDSDSIVTGQDIILIGNPLGQLGGTVTKGIISATSREISGMDLIQIDAAANPGNSGGGLFNMKGELIGILNSGFREDQSGTTIDGISFCIPVNEAIRIANELQENGYVTGKPYLGISAENVTDVYTAYYYFRSQSLGVYITDTVKGYNDKVLKYGDRVAAIGDTEITATTDISECLQSHKVGDVLDFTIVREGKVIHVDVTCYEYVPSDITVTEK